MIKSVKKWSIPQFQSSLSILLPVLIFSYLGKSEDLFSLLPRPVVNLIQAIRS